jgi:hypothetical protein
MLTALILVCSLAATPDLSACTQDNASAVLRDPETFTSPVGCLMHAQAYLAATAIGRDLSGSEAVKVVCVPSRGAAIPSRGAASRTITTGANSTTE